MACGRFAMPGPSSRATTHRPRLAPWFSGRRMISPRLACSAMLRDTSEMAAVIKVTSTPSKPNSWASKRPCCRAVTMSSTDAIVTRVSLGTTKLPLGALIEIGQAFLEIQGRADPFQRQTQLDHRERHFGLDPDDDSLGSAQAQHVRNRPQSARRERIDDIQHCYVNDDTS